MENSKKQKKQSGLKTMFSQMLVESFKAARNLLVNLDHRAVTQYAVY